MVTGASRGIGACTGELLAGRGARVAVSARTVSDLENLAVKIAEERRGSAGDPLRRDGSRRRWKRWFKPWLQKWGRLDILVNNAGIGNPTHARGADSSRGLGSNRGPESQIRLSLRPGGGAGHEKSEIRTDRQCLFLCRTELRPPFGPALRRGQGRPPGFHQTHGRGIGPFRDLHQCRCSQHRPYGAGPKKWEARTEEDTK